MKQTFGFHSNIVEFILRYERSLTLSFKSLFIFFFSGFILLQSYAQDSSVVTTSQFTDSIVKSPNQSTKKLTDQQIKSRIRLVTIANIAGYGGTMIGLN